MHHSVSYVSPRPTMRSDGAQLFPTSFPKTAEPLSETKRERESKDRDIYTEKVQTSRDKEERGDPNTCQPREDAKCHRTVIKK